MPESPRNGSTIDQPPANQVNLAPERAPRSDVAIICDTRDVSRPVIDSYGNCRPKWLAKLLNLFGDRTD